MIFVQVASQGPMLIMFNGLCHHSCNHFHESLYFILSNHDILQLFKAILIAFFFIFFFFISNRNFIDKKVFNVHDDEQKVLETITCKSKRNSSQMLENKNGSALHKTPNLRPLKQSPN